MLRERDDDTPRSPTHLTYSLLEILAAQEDLFQQYRSYSITIQTVFITTITVSLQVIATSYSELFQKLSIFLGVGECKLGQQPVADFCRTVTVGDFGQIVSYLLTNILLVAFCVFVSRFLTFFRTTIASRSEVVTFLQRLIVLDESGELEKICMNFGFSKIPIYSVLKNIEQFGVRKYKVLWYPNFYLNHEDKDDLQKSKSAYWRQEEFQIDDADKVYKLSIYLNKFRNKKTIRQYSPAVRLIRRMRYVILRNSRSLLSQAVLLSIWFPLSLFCLFLRENRLYMSATWRRIETSKDSGARNFDFVFNKTVLTLLAIAICYACISVSICAFAIASVLVQN